MGIEVRVARFIGAKLAARRPLAGGLPLGADAPEPLLKMAIDELRGRYPGLEYD